MNGGSVLALVLSITALLVSAFQVSLRIGRKAEESPRLGSDTYIKLDALLDQRSFLQAALRSMVLQLESGTSVTRDAAERTVRLILGNPLLVASPVLPDVELSRLERNTRAEVIWIVTSNEAIEFAYSNLSGTFSSVVIDNLSRGVVYRYLVPRSERSERRRALMSQDYPGIEVRLMNPDDWSREERLVDEYVIYDSRRGDDRAVATGYYLYPASSPRRWIRMDPETAFARLRDLEAQWELGS